MDSVIRLIGNMLRNNILCTGNSLCHGSYFFFLGYKSLCFFLDGLICHLKHNDVCQWLKAFFLGNGGTGTSLRTVWAVKILHNNQGLGGKDLLLQLFCQLALVLNAGKNLFLFVFQIAQVSQSFIQITKLLVI